MSENTSNRWLRTAALAGAAGLIVTAGAIAVPASAAPAASSTGTADIRAAHLSPDVAGVDVYLTAFRGGTTKLWVNDEQYGGVSKYVSVPAGEYAVSMRQHGAAMSSTPVLSWNLDAQAGQAYTAAAVGDAKDLTGTVLKDDLTPPAPGKGRIRLIQASSRAPKATVSATDGPVIASNATFPTSTGYAQVPAGTWPLVAKSVTNSLSTDAKVSVRSGSVTSLLLLDSRTGDGITLTSVLDSASAAVMPKGPVPAGGGGMAPNAAPSSTDSSSVLPVMTSVAAGVVVLLGMLVVLVSRRRQARPATR